jgi:hypothetical protein
MKPQRMQIYTEKPEQFERYIVCVRQPELFQMTNNFTPNS